MTAAYAALITTSVQFIDKESCMLVLNRFRVELPEDAPELDEDLFSEAYPQPQVSRDYTSEALYLSMSDSEKSRFNTVTERKAISITRQVQAMIQGQVYDRDTIGLYIETLVAYYSGRVSTLIAAGKY